MKLRVLVGGLLLVTTLLLALAIAPVHTNVRILVGGIGLLFLVALLIAMVKNQNRGGSEAAADLGSVELGVNPASGLPLMQGMSKLDIHGNPFGSGPLDTKF